MTQAFQGCPVSDRGLSGRESSLRGVGPVLAADPQLIIIAETRPGSFQPEQLPLLESTDAGAHGRVLVADGMRLLGFGPRLPDAMEEVLEVATGEGR